MRGMIGNRLRRIPNRHDGVADVFVDGAAGFSLNNARKRVEVETEHVGKLIGGELLGKRRKTFDVAEHD